MHGLIVSSGIGHLERGFATGENVGVRTVFDQHLDQIKSVVPDGHEEWEAFRDPVRVRSLVQEEMNQMRPSRNDELDQCIPLLVLEMIHRSIGRPRKPLDHLAEHSKLLFLFRRKIVSLHLFFENFDL